MQNNQMDLLVTFDENYIAPFKTMLTSVIINNPGQGFRVWLLHSAIPNEQLQALDAYCTALHVSLTPITVQRELFENAPVSDQYPQEMYYRLLAPHLLPTDLKRVLYLDPDVLVINPLKALWDLPLKEFAFAAASHGGVADIINGVNRVRLNTEHDYYNTGVMLIDLEKARQIIQPAEIFEYVREHKAELLLPDQDVFNTLYGKQVFPLEDILWNYDARFYSRYLIQSGRVSHMDWIMKNTAILHFCGKRKPWRRAYANRFAALYKNYMQIAIRCENTDC